MESKHPLFISYTQENFNKVTIVEEEVNKSKYFYPLVIARNREPLKLLTDKVEEGILMSYAIIPILTEQSINTQWVNQEIAFAHAHKIQILPIVDKSIIGKLKGFIHKERDLPYMFTESDNNSFFLDSVRSLIKDLEASIDKAKIEPKQSDTRRDIFDSVIETLRKHKKLADKQQFFNSPQGRIIGVNEAIRLFQIIIEKTEETKKYTDFPIKTVQDKNGLNISISCRNLKVYIGVHFVSNHTRITVSYITEHKRHGLKSPTNRTRKISIDKVYHIDEVSEKYGWALDGRRNDFYSSEEIAFYAFNWIVNELTAKVM